MLRKISLIILVFILAAGTLAAYAWLAGPRLVEIHPLAGGHGIPAGIPLLLTFSQPMDWAGVQARLNIEPETAGAFEVDGSQLRFTPSPGWAGGETITITLAAGARAAGWPGLPLLRSQTWAFRASPPLVVYLWPHTGLADLYALDPASGEIQRLTTEARVVDFAPDAAGSVIYFSADKLSGGSLLLSLNRFKWAAAPEQPPDLETVLDCGAATCRSPAPSPDGRWLAYERAPLATTGASSSVSVWLLELATGDQRPAAVTADTTQYPAWAPDGSLVVYNLTRQAYQVFSAEELLSGEGFLEFPNQVGDPASWQPDGKAFLAAEIFEDAPGLVAPTLTGHILRRWLDSPALPEDLTTQDKTEDTLPVVSPNGRQIAFARKFLDPMRWTPGRQLWLMAADGSQAIQVTDDPYYTQYAFAWSPDSSQLAYLRFNQVELNQPPELWVVGADGKEPVQLVIGGYNPRWLP